MTVGLPGTGIGGMFYLLSALAMPLREAVRRLRGVGSTASPRWRMVATQAALAGGILAGMWVTGWLLGLAVHALPPALHLTATHHPAANALRVTALVLSFATLAAVLSGVELARLCIQRRPAGALAAEDAPPVEPRMVAAAGTRRRRRGRTLVAVALLGAAATSCPHHAAAQSTLARADSAFAAGSSGVAAREYAATLAADPANSHAVYRLAQLSRDDPARALRLFQRYVTLQPTDPWGYMAVGDVLGRLGRYDEALAWYDRALRLAPAERDAVVGRARLLARARRTDAAITAYEQWLAAHAADVDAWRALARE
jgi:tetratricopeptide (TPR) repeat protein